MYLSLFINLSNQFTVYLLISPNVSEAVPETVVECEGEGAGLAGLSTHHPTQV